MHCLIFINVLDIAVIIGTYYQFLRDTDISTRKSKTEEKGKYQTKSGQLSETDGLNSLDWPLIAKFYYNTKTSNFIHIKASSY